MTEWAEQPSTGDNQGVPGKTLAAQREALGWSVEQVADQLKLAVRQVVALEAGDYANLPGPAVVRGFVRAYAKILKLDPAPLVAMIALDTASAPDTTPTTVRRDKPASFSEVRFPTNGKRSRAPYGLIAAVVVVAGAAVAVWQTGLVANFLPGHGGSAAPAAAASTPSSAAASVTVLPPPVTGGLTAPIETTTVKPGEENKPLQSPSVPLISVPPPSQPSPAAALPAAPAVTAGPAVQPAAPASGNNLVLTVREDSWVEVKRAKGRPLLSKLLKAGSTETVEIKEPVTLIVGKPSGVDASLRGAALALPPVAGGTVSRVAVE